jgi:Caspase domain
LPKEELLTKSIVLQNNLLAALPQRDTDLNITVIDACRTDLRNALGDEDGFNQVEAPLGSLVCFSTGAGKPAISPASANQNTFFTASLVKLLRESEDHTTFNDLFRFVKADVYKTMSNHPVAAIRTLAQVPFIADNTRLQVPLKWRSSAFESPVEKAMSQEELDKWKELDAQCWPVDIVRLGKAFLASYPQSALSSKVQLIVQGAQEALSVLRNKEVRLYKASFVLPESYSNEQTALELVKAGRGDKDAAVRIARAYRLLQTEQAMLRFEGWMQYATGLGNGIASYELALYYREAGLALPAAQAEAQAKVLGYVPPRSLGHVRS